MTINEVELSNRYYWNEYSLRGQFKTVEEFATSMQEHTLPLLNDIMKNNGVIFFKKTDFWQMEICPNYTLDNMTKDSKVRYASLSALKIKIQKLMYDEPYWDLEEIPNIRIKTYKFDMEYCQKFAKDNCFLHALENSDNIISFWHEEYQKNRLYFDIECKNGIEERYLPNMACVAHLPEISITRQWRIRNGVNAFIRLKEPANHKPHFHIKCDSGYEGSFDLFTGEPLKDSGVNLKRMRVEVRDWHKENISDLKEAWIKFHGEFTNPWH